MTPTPAVRFRDATLLIVSKPAGLPTQAPRGGGPNLYDLLRAEHPGLGLHHRLDTPASGLVLFTLDARANAPIAAAFREHRIQREYLAAALGDPGEEGEWTWPIEGQPARTRWRRLRTLGGLSWLGCALHTGRTHQIRLHAEAAGHPLLGDRRHGGAAGRLWPRLALHAARLALRHPRGGGPLEVEDPLPDDLVSLWDRGL